MKYVIIFSVSESTELYICKVKVVISSRVECSTLSASSGLRFSQTGSIRCTLTWTHLGDVDLTMTECAMLEAQLVQLREQSLMLADLASVVVLQEDTLTRGDTGREVTTTFAAVDVIIVD